VQDQTESWYRTNGGRKLADNQRRGLAGMGGRFISTPNAWDPVEDSVAQVTRVEAPGVYHDDVEPGSGSVRNKADRRRMLRKRLRRLGDEAAPGREWEPWIDLDRIDGEIVALLEHDAAQAERWFLNRKMAGESAAFDIDTYRELAQPRDVPDRTLVVLGVDGARFRDALAIRGVEVLTGYQFTVGIWQRPERAAPDYEHPADEVDARMTEAFRRWDVWRAYCDPQYIEHLVDRWQGRWGDKRVVSWFTNRDRQVAYAVRNLATAIGARDLAHDGDRWRSSMSATRASARSTCTTTAAGRCTRSRRTGTTRRARSTPRWRTCSPGSAAATRSPPARPIRGPVSSSLTS
jgi:hypothetical protein